MTKKRLIDANELLRKHKYDVRNWGEPYAVLISSIENAPTVDAMEVVHGKTISKPFMIGQWQMVIPKGLP